MLLDVKCYLENPKFELLNNTLAIFDQITNNESYKFHSLQPENFEPSSLGTTDTGVCTITRHRCSSTCSSATVSNALNTHPIISTQTQVQQCIKVKKPSPIVSNNMTKHA